MATTNVRPNAPTNPPERLLDVHEAASRLGMKVSTLRAWTYQRRIPVVKLLGRTVRFRERDLQRLIAESTRPPLKSVN